MIRRGQCATIVACKLTTFSDRSISFARVLELFARRIREIVGTDFFVRRCSQYTRESALNRCNRYIWLLSLVVIIEIDKSIQRRLQILITLHACSACISKNPKRTMQNTGVSDLGLREAIVGDVLKHSSICTARTLVGCTDELMPALVPGARCLVVQACGYTRQFSFIVRYNRACILPATRRTRRGQRWTAGWQLSRERRW